MTESVENPSSEADIGRAGFEQQNRLKITTWRELSSHLQRADKSERYRQLLRAYGIDPDAAEVAELRGRPALLFFEQPGCYLTPRDMVRARLLERLVQRRGFDAELSGVRVLEHDRFTNDGEKAVFLEFCLHNDLGPAKLFSAQFAKKHKHQTYASLKISGSSFQRMRAIWDYSLLLLEAAADSPARCVEVLEELKSRSPQPGACDLLPAGEARADLERIAADMTECRAEAAFKALWPARTHLRRDIPWDLYWSQVNAEFLELPIGSISALLERFVLAIDDPVRLARRLHESLGAGSDEPISVAGLATEREIFRTVLFDPTSEAFFIARGDGSRDPITWDEIRAAASSGRGARPAGVVLYLMLAAFGNYLLVDCGDSVQPFQEEICRLHEQEMGLKYPWVTFEVRGGLERPENPFINVFRPGFVELTVDALSRFFES